MAGRTIFIFLCLIAFLLSIPAASHTGLTTWTSLAASSTAFVAMSLNLFLATRPSFLEPLFGGLDRMYRFHRFLGMTALALILVHYFLKPNFRDGLILSPILNSLANTAGKWGFYGLVALIAFSLFKRIPFTKIEVPYQLWRNSHRFIGIFFILIAFHFFFIKRPFTGDVLLAGYLTIFALLGLGSYLVTQVVPFLRRRGYEISDIIHLPAATILEAKPVGWPVKARPGQFGFIHLNRPGLREPHPFTIAGRGEDGSLRFAIKPLGDFTRRLRETAQKGDRMRVEGGYGHFVHTRGGDRQLWLAGGIGITPFLAMAASLKPDERRQIHLVHVVKDAKEAVDDAVLFAKAQEIGNFSFVLHDTTASGRIDADKLRAGVPFELSGADLWFCGPPPLREAIVNGLRKAGCRLRRVEFERFEFR